MATNVWLGTDATTPNSWSVAANWSLAAIPANGDNVFLPAGNTVSITAGLNQSAVTLASLNIDPNFCAGKVGVGVLTGIVVTYLQIGATVINFPAGTGSGATLIAINTAAVTGTVNLQQSNGSTTPPIRLLGTALTLNQTGGSIGAATSPGETATIASARMSTGPGSAAPSLTLGSGVTLTDAYIEAGTCINSSAQVMPAVRVAGGVYDYRGTGAHTQIDVDAGTCYYSGTGTINGNTVVRGTLDFRRDDRAKVVTNSIMLAAGSSCYANSRYVTAAAAAPLGVKTYHCRLSDIQALDLGTNLTMTAVAA